MTTTLGEFLKSINKTKINLMEDDEQVKNDYVPYIINKCLSYFPDTIILVNEINQLANLDKEMQYNFLLSSIRPRSRFSKWTKKEKIDEVDVVRKYYNYSFKRAEEIYDLLTEDQLKFIKEQMDYGGIHK